MIEATCTNLELNVVVGATNKMNQTSQPGLLFDSLVGFHCTSLTRGTTRISSWLLHAFLNQDLQDLQDALEILRSRDLGLVP